MVDGGGDDRGDEESGSSSSLSRISAFRTTSLRFSFPMRNGGSWVAGLGKGATVSGEGLRRGMRLVVGSVGSVRSVSACSAPASVDSSISSFAAPLIASSELRSNSPLVSSL